MDVQKILKKLPAFVKKFKDAKNIDGKVTYQDFLFALEILDMAVEGLVNRPHEAARYFMAASQPGEGLDVAHHGLDPKNHEQMMDYLSTIPDKLERGLHAKASQAGVPVEQAGATEPVIDMGDHEDREAVEWLPLIMFGVDLAMKFLAAWKKK
jgi:hypothetical protein